MKETGKHIESSGPVNALSPSAILLDDQNLMLRLNVSKGTLRNWRKSGLLPFHKLGKRVYYTEHDFMEMLRQNRHVKYNGRYS
jgi:predicted site-specific integrase-resolvase